MNVSRPLQNQILAMRAEEVNPDSISHFCRRLTSITEDNLEDLSFEHIYALLEISCKIIQYFKSTPIHESYINKQTLKSLSETISFYNYLLNYNFPITLPSKLSLDGFNFHELEEMATLKQQEINKYLETISEVKASAQDKVEPVYRNLKIILDKPRFGLMLFEYSSGIQAFFPHEENTIKMHNQVQSSEVREKLNELISKYGNGTVEKIIQTRKKWDFDYVVTFDSILKEVEAMTRYNTEDMSEDISCISKELVHSKSARLINSLNSPHGFNEGKEVIVKDFVWVDMSAYLDKCVKTGLRCYDDDIEIILNL